MAQVKVTARMSRNYGPMTVEFELEQTIETSNAAGILRANNSMIEALKIQFIEFDKEHLKTLPLPESKGLPEARTTAPQKGWYVAKEMYKSVQDGKVYYHIRTTNCPQANKYGAAVYFDRFTGLTEDEFNAQLDAKTLKHVLPDGMRVLVEFFKGKPRAIQLAHKDTIGEG